MNALKKGLNVMNFTEVLLSEKLKAAEPTLDLLGADRKVLKVAYDDFKNYEKFLSFKSVKAVECSNSDSSKTSTPSKKDDPEELSALLGGWTCLWLKKWKERCSLIIGQTNTNQHNVDYEAAAKAQATWARFVNREELIEMVTITLIKNGEVCLTGLIAEDIVRKELIKNPNLDSDCPKQVLTLLNSCLNKAHETSKRTGPLIYIKVEKNYYS